MTKSKDMANPIILDLGLFLWTFGSGNHAPVRPDVTIHFLFFWTGLYSMYYPGGLQLTPKTFHNKC